MNINRVVIWFSAGVTSAVAAKLTVNKYRGVLPIHLVNTDTGSEHEDNYRFMNDVSKWLDLPLEIIRSEKYQNTFEVYDASGWFLMVGAGAKCTTELKKLPRRMYERVATDLQVFGFDASERRRGRKFQENNPEVNAWFPLIEEGVTKSEARQMLKQAGIVEPLTYGLGFKNANCLAAGCIKGGMGYWNHYRKVFPEAFDRMARKERELGFAINATEKRVDGKRIKTPVFLDELPESAGNHDAEEAIQCGLFCGTI